MPNNIDRRYSKITRDGTLTDLNEIAVNKVGPLGDLGKSAYGQLVMELFAAHADTDAAWIEASFRDSFLESATSTSAIYAGARGLGYSVRRRIPAKAGFGIVLKRTGKYGTVNVNLPKGTTFTVAGKTLTLIDDVEFAYDRTDPNHENGLMRIVSGRPVLADGTIKNLKFFSNGSQNQEIIVPDVSFSDWFGFGDPNHVEPNTMEDRMSGFTVISTDASLVDNVETIDGEEEKIYWRISRRGLHDPNIVVSDINDIDNFEANSNSNKTLNYTALLTTANDGRLKIEFGDGINGAIPFGAIDLTYFSTTGEAGNTLNVSGSEMNLEGNNILIAQADGSASDLTISDLTIALTTDIRGGLDIEDNESIKKNAPKLFNSLDSLHNKNSYITYLRRISDVKYANAFGEDVLNKVKPKGRFDIRYSNIVRFTLLKDLYRQKEGNYFTTSPFEYYMEGYKVNGLTYLWDYDYDDLPNSDDLARFNINATKIEEDLKRDGIRIIDTEPSGVGKVLTTEEFMAKYIIPYDLNKPLVPESVFTAQLTPKDFVETGSELDNILDQLNRKGYITLGDGQHSYVHPIVHDMSMDIDVILFEGGIFNDIKTRIINNIYAYLKENTEFAKPIFRSKVECIVQKMPEVAGLNLKFKAKPNSFETFDLNEFVWLGESTSQIINQTTLSLEGFDVSLDYDYVSGTGNESLDNTQNFFIGNQTVIQEQIKGYYNSRIAYKDSNGDIKPRKDLTEEDINKFTGYIWSVAMNEMYNSLFDIYETLRAEGQAIEADKVFGIMEALRGWHFVNGELAFNDTETIFNMEESGSSNTLAFYKIYTLEYIKLVRNILATTVSVRLIDEDGNISNYSNSNETVQFTVKPSNIKLDVGTT